MKHTPFFTSVLVLSISSTAVARPRTEPPLGVGAGIVLGVPTGISLAYRVSSTRHFNAALAWSVTHDSLHLHVDYLFEIMQVVDPNAPMYQFPLYSGIGARIQIEPEGPEEPGVSKATAPLFGLRAPVGITFLPQAAPFEVFAEIAPVMSLYPSTRVTFDGAIGARYYF